MFSLAFLLLYRIWMYFAIDLRIPHQLSSRSRYPGRQVFLVANDEPSSPVAPRTPMYIGKKRVNSQNPIPIYLKGQ